jgi:hypothetical protein
MRNIITILINLQYVWAMYKPYKWTTIDDGEQTIKTRDNVIGFYLSDAVASYLY